MITSTKSPDFKSGLWTASDDAEVWSGLTFHDTREAALIDYYEDYGELPRYVGQITIMTDEEVVNAILRDQQDADEAIGIGRRGSDHHDRNRRRFGRPEVARRIQDEWRWYEDQIIDYTGSQFDELFSLVLGWVKKHNVNPKLWNVTGEPVTETLEDLLLAEETSDEA